MGEVQVNNPRIEVAKDLFLPTKAKVGTTFVLPSGVFIVKKPMVIPSGTSLEGSGAMIFAPGGRPAGFAAGSATILRADPSFVGDIVTLKDGARLAGVRVEDVSRPPPQTGNNLIVVSSSKPGDKVAATVEECELYNPNDSGQDKDKGPLGRAVLVFTRNLNRAIAPPPDSDSFVSLFMRHSKIESPGGGTGVFAINFAPRCRVIVRLEQNVIGGGIDAVGGVSRPDLVENSQVVIFSMLNQYRNDAPTPTYAGWTLHGGANPPGQLFQAKTITTANNMIFVESKNDEIIGFQTGIHAAGGWKPFESTSTVNQNRASLILTSLVISSTVSDVALFGATAGGGIPTDPPSFTPGNDNQLLVVASFGTASSGVKPNSYATVAMIQGKLATADAGSGNRLQIHGNPPYNKAPPSEFVI